MFQNIDLAEVAIWYFCLLLSLCVHEAAHAAMANRCGDPTARLLGRLTLNPVAHIDLIGTVVMPLLMITTNVGCLIGWAKPVPINPVNFHNMRRDQVLVSIAGPGSNLVLAFVAATVLRIAVTIAGPENAGQMLSSPLMQIMLVLMFTNIALMVFNLLPIPPLDGGWVLHYFLPPAGQRALEQFGQFGILLVILVGGKLIAIPFAIVLTAATWFIGL